MTNSRNAALLVILCVLCGLCFIHASGAYDHGTSTGKGNLEVDFTWNPLNIFDQGQSYVVFGYGLTERLDLHGYYAHPVEGNDNFYTGLFYQFLDLKHIDLATAIGIRQYVGSSEWHIFVPQVLYNIKLGKGFTVGGSSVTLQRGGEKLRSLGTTFDVALFVPLTPQFDTARYQEAFQVVVRT